MFDMEKVSKRLNRWVKKEAECTEIPSLEHSIAHNVASTLRNIVDGTWTTRKQVEQRIYELNPKRTGLKKGFKKRKSAYESDPNTTGEYTENMDPISVPLTIIKELKMVLKYDMIEEDD